MCIDISNRKMKTNSTILQYDVT